jgi:hypothetical protein
MSQSNHNPQSNHNQDSKSGQQISLGNMMERMADAGVTQSMLSTSDQKKLQNAQLRAEKDSHNNSISGLQSL